jgi:hypothetical protein
MSTPTKPLTPQNPHEHRRFLFHQLGILTPPNDYNLTRTLQSSNQGRKPQPVRNRPRIPQTDCHKSAPNQREWNTLGQ